MLGRIYEEFNHNKTLIIFNYKEAIKYNASYDEAYIRLGDKYLALTEISKAEKAYESAINIYNSSDYWVKLG